MPHCHIKTRRKTRRKGGAQSLLNYATRGNKPTDTEKKYMKIHKIVQSLSKGSPTKLKSYSIPHIDRTFNFSSAKTYDDPDLSPLGDDADKFKRTLHKMTYAQLKKLSNNPQSWNEAASDLFMLKWRSTPSLKKSLPLKNQPGFLVCLTFQVKNLKRKKGKKNLKRKKVKNLKRKKGKTRRR